MADLRRGLAGAIIGDNIGFWIGDKGGYRLARRYGSKVRLDERKLKTARYLFGRHGVPVVFFGRFIVWAGIYTAVPYLAGTWLQRTSGTIDWILGGIAVVAIAAVVLLVCRQAGRLAERAEQAYPGPLDGPARRLESSGRARPGKESRND